MERSILKSEEQFGASGLHIWRRRPVKQYMHAHDYYQLWYVASGRCIHIVEGREYPMEAGGLYVLPPYVFHSMYSCEGTPDLIGVDFTRDFLEELGMPPTEQIYLPKIKAAREIENLLSEMLFEYQNKPPYFEYIIKAGLQRVLARAMREGRSEKGVEGARLYKLIEPAIDHIYNNYSCKITLEDVCRVTALSPSHFSYLFKCVTGKSFTKYLNYVRVMKAAEMLLTTGKSITEIAFDCGFNDLAYFCRVFKKEIGVPPAKYRK